MDGNLTVHRAKIKRNVPPGRESTGKHFSLAIFPLSK